MIINNPPNPISKFFLFMSMIFGMFAAFIFLMAIFPRLGGLANVLRCKVYGGTWFEGSMRMCIINYKDGGKICYGKSDCTGLCFADNSESSAGKCAKNNIFYGNICILKEKDTKPQCIFYNPYN